MIDPTRDVAIRRKHGELREAFPDDPESTVYTAVADYFELTGDLERAIAALERAAKLAPPEDARTRFILARTLLKAGRYRDGGRELEICSEIDSVELAGRAYYDNNLYYLGYALFNVGRYKEAAEALRGAQNLVNIWVDPLVLKRFHLHQGWAWHLEGDFLDAAECYKRALIAPGPGDSCVEDVMNEDVVEAAQRFNQVIEPFLDEARMGHPLDPEDLEATPAFP